MLCFSFDQIEFYEMKENILAVNVVDDSVTCECYRNSKLFVLNVRRPDIE